MPREKRQKPVWYKLDNAAMMYSAIQKENYSAIYRFSAVMTELVDPEALQRAIDKTLPRFPGFRVRIKRGAFWYYFEPNGAPGPFVKEDMKNPCQPVRFGEDDGWLIRFFYYGHRISLEVFHALADGAGSLTLLRTLLAVYLRELGHDIPNTDGVLDIDEPPPREEQEDAYFRYAKSRVRKGMGDRRAYQGNGTPEPFYTLNVTMGLVPLDKLRETAHGYGASVTEYLGGGAYRGHTGQAAPGGAAERAACGSGSPHQSAAPLSVQNAAELHPDCPALHRSRAGRLHFS